jgi:hypothetical protein
MSIPKITWGAPRIHGELLKLGIDIGETSVSEYLANPLLNVRHPRAMAGQPGAGHGTSRNQSVMVP